MGKTEGIFGCLFTELFTLSATFLLAASIRSKWEASLLLGTSSSATSIEAVGFTESCLTFAVVVAAIGVAVASIAPPLYLKDSSFMR